MKKKLGFFLIFIVCISMLPFPQVQAGYEDFGTYTETDPNAHITVGANLIVHDAYADEDAFVYKDFGVDYFGDFIHYVDFKSAAGNARNDRCVVWGMANSVNDFWHAPPPMSPAMFVGTWDFNNKRTLQFMEFSGGGFFDMDGKVGLAINTWYYLIIEKSGVDVTCEIYSNSARTVLVDTLIGTLHADHQWRYLYASATRNSASANIHAVVQIANLNIFDNTNPTITSASISDRDDGDNCYEMESYYDFVTVVDDLEGADTIAKVYHQIKQGGGVIAEIRATTLDGVPSYAIQTGANIIDLDVGSCSWAEAGNQGTLHLLVRFEWDFTDQADLEISIYVEDTDAGSAGFTVMQTNYFDVIGRLVITDFIVDDGRINLGGTATFSGKVNYATTVSGDTASAKYPLDAQFTDVAIHDSGHVERGTDVSIINGVFSGISFAIPSAVQSNTYHVYLDVVPDYLDGDAPDGDTVAVIGDRIIILTLTANVTLLEVGEYAQLRLTAELEFDSHGLGAGDFVEINSTVFVWDAGDSRFEVDVTSAIVGNFTYNLYTDGLEATFTITAGIMDGNFVTLEFIIYPPSNPVLLFGAGFNASFPYVELHWVHNLSKVQFFEVQNSTDGISWDYLGQSATTNYTDSQVLNGTNRYYQVRACNQTGGNWYNSSFTDVNFETVYFVMGAVVGPGGGAIGLIMIILICTPLIVLVARVIRNR